MAIIAKVVNGKIDSSVSTDKVAAKNANTNIGNSKLGYDEFLKLLTAEMQYQDPLEPTSNTDYVAQMATFSQLEATLSMKESLTTSSDNTIKSMANQLVGQEVVVKDDESKTGYADGIVDYVMYDDGEIYISVNDKLYSIDKLDKSKCSHLCRDHHDHQDEWINEFFQSKVICMNRISRHG